MAVDRGLLLLFLLSAAALAGVASAAAPFLSGECVLVLLAANFAFSVCNYSSNFCSCLGVQTACSR